MSRFTFMSAPLAVSVAVAVLCGGALAQSGTNAGQGAGPATQSATPPAAEKPSVLQRLSEKKRASWWGAEVTPGWALMSWQERNEHRKIMRSMTSYEECKAYLNEHHARMAERARAEGRSPLQEPRRDACAGLKS